MKDLPSFEVLAKLAKEDPEALEAIRKEAVDSLIDSAPEKHKRRLRGLQFQIDMERQKAKNPMDSCIRVSKMMHSSFAELRDALNEAQKTHINELKKILSNTGTQAKRVGAAAPHKEAIQTTNQSILSNVVQFPSH